MNRTELIRAVLIKRAERKRALDHVNAQYIITRVAEQFHRATRKVRSFRGPNQAGKTVAGAREMVYCLLGYSPYRKVRSAPVEAKLSSFSFDQSIKAQRVLHKLIPPWMFTDDCKFDYERGFTNHRITLKNGSILTFFSDNQATLAHSSDSLDYVWFDEPPKAGKYGENIARLLVKSGEMWLTYTPIGCPVEWLKEEVERGAIEDIQFSLTPENAPHLSEERINEIIEAYLPEERDQRVHGAWEGVSPDRKFTKFKPQTHLIEDADIPSIPMSILIGADHGEKSNNEYFIIIGVYVLSGLTHIVALAEYTGQAGGSPVEDAKGVQAALDSLGLSLFDVTEAKGDVNTAGKLGAGKSINELLERAFATLAQSSDPPFPIRKPDKRGGSVLSGTRRINNAFSKDQIRISPRCKQLLTSIRYWDGNDNEHKHAIDAFRYIVADFLKDDTQPSKLRIV